MTPDPNTLMAVNASDCTRDALLNNQALHRKRARDESATLAAQATAIPPCFDTLITSFSIRENPALICKRHLPEGMIAIRTL
jgi:hypothetical protein